MHSALPRGTETVLVVEDEDAVRLIVRRVLRDQGYEILEARDGNEALRICAQKGGSIDLVLSDVIMPGGMNGLDLARQLRTTRSDLPVLLSSGYTAQQFGLHETLEGVELLRKPYTLSALSRAVERLIQPS